MSRISVARFEDAAGRNSFAPWLDVRLEPAAGGGTTLTGRIGLHPAVPVVMSVIAGAGGLIAMGALAGGVALLVSGHISGSLPAVLIPLAVTALIVGFNVAGLRSLDRDIPNLIQEMRSLAWHRNTAFVCELTPGGRAWQRMPAFVESYRPGRRIR